MVGNEMEEATEASKKLMGSHTFSGTFPSPPGSEDGRAMGHRHPKGWYSERLPQSGYRGGGGGGLKAYAATAALLPFSSGRALPSKWDDAERWICSPVSVGNVSNYGNTYFYGTGVHKGSHLGYKAQRRAKSKSGPLGPAGFGLYGNYNTFSPVLGVGVINGGKWRNSLAVDSPAELGVHTEGLDDNGDERRRRSCPGRDDPEWLNVWTDPFSHTDKHTNDDMGTTNDNSLRDYNDEKGGVCEEEAGVDRVVSRRDMATQMYPESESSSLYSANSPSSLLLNNEAQMNSNNNNNVESPEFGVRDVQIDRQTSGATQRRSTQMSDPNHKNNSCSSYATAIVNAADDKMFKLEREEARINAWENLQKANAESEIQKLEMKLEKKRASSMEKIIEKLRRAEIKAHKMRGSLVANVESGRHHHASSKTARSKIPSFCTKFRMPSSSSSTCFPF